MVDLATFGSALSRGIARNTSPERQQQRATARAIQAEQEAKLRKIQLQNTPEMQQLQVDAEREELELLRAQNAQTRRSLLKNRVMDTLKEYDGAPNTQVLNRMITDMRNEGMSPGPLLGNIVRFDPVGEGDRQAFANSGYDPDDIITSPEAANSLVRVTLDDGTTEIRNLDDFKASVGYMSYASAQERQRMRERLELEQIRKQLAAPDAIEIAAAASRNRIKELQETARLRVPDTQQERDLAITMLAKHSDLVEGTTEWAQAYEQERKAYEQRKINLSTTAKERLERIKGEEKRSTEDVKAKNQINQIIARGGQTRLTNKEKIAAQSVANQELAGVKANFDSILQSEKIQLEGEERRQLEELSAILQRQTASIQIKDQLAADKDKAQFQAKLDEALQNAVNTRKSELAGELVALQSKYDAANTAQEIALRADAEVKVADYKGKLKRLATSEEITQRAGAAQDLATLQAELDRVTNSLNVGDRATAQQEAIKLQGSINQLLQSDRIAASSTAAKELAQLNSDLSIIANSARVSEQLAADTQLASVQSGLRQGETAARIDQQLAADAQLAGVQSGLRQGETTARIDQQLAADAQLAGVQSGLRQGETTARIDQQLAADTQLAGVQSGLRQGETTARIAQQLEANTQLEGVRSGNRREELSARIEQQLAADTELEGLRANNRLTEVAARIAGKLDADTQLEGLRSNNRMEELTARVKQELAADTELEGLKSDNRLTELATRIAQELVAEKELAGVRSDLRQEETTARIDQQAAANLARDAARPQPQQRRTQQDIDVRNIMLAKSEYADLEEGTPEWAQAYERERQAYIQGNFAARASSMVRRTPMDAELDNYMMLNHPELTPESQEYANVRGARQAELEYQKTLPKNAAQTQINEYMETNFPGLSPGSPEYVRESLKFRQQILRDKQLNRELSGRSAAMKEDDRRVQIINDLRSQVARNFEGRRFVDVPREELDEDPTVETAIESIERLGKLSMTNDEKETFREVAELMSFAGSAKALTDQQTGIIDSTLGKLSRYISNDTQGIMETAAYASFRNMFQRAISGLTVTKAEADSFAKQIPELTQQRGPVLASMRVAVEGLKSRLEAISSLNNSLVSHYRLGMTKQKVRESIRGIDSLLRTLNNTSRALPLDQQARQVDQAAQGAFTLTPERMAEMEAIFSGGVQAPSAEVTGEVRRPPTPTQPTQPVTLTPERMAEMRRVLEGG